MASLLRQPYDIRFVTLDFQVTLIIEWITVLVYDHLTHFCGQVQLGLGQLNQSCRQ